MYYTPHLIYWFFYYYLLALPGKLPEQNEYQCLVDVSFPRTHIALLCPSYSDFPPLFSKLFCVYTRRDRLFFFSHCTQMSWPTIRYTSVILLGRTTLFRTLRMTFDSRKLQISTFRVFWIPGYESCFERWRLPMFSDLENWHI